MEALRLFGERVSRYGDRLIYKVGMVLALLDADGALAIGGPTTLKRCFWLNSEEKRHPNRKSPALKATILCSNFWPGQPKGPGSAIGRASVALYSALWHARIEPLSSLPLSAATSVSVRYTFCHVLPKLYATH